MEKTASDFISAVSDAEDRDLLVMAHGFLTELVMRKKSKKPNIKEENLNSQQQINTAIALLKRWAIYYHNEGDNTEMELFDETEKFCIAQQQ